ncbi:MAG: aminotransferase class V-fold PLP-dependent enzyme, partial [Rhodothermales bacterium]
MSLIYLDHAATTPLHPLVLEAMMPFLTEDFGNASSVHALGRRARFAVEESREKVASF